MKMYNNYFYSGLFMLTLIAGCTNTDNKKIVNDLRNASLEKKSSFLCDDFVYELVDEVEFPAGESSIKQLLGSYEGLELSNTKTTIQRIENLNGNQVEVISTNENWVYDCFGIGISTTSEVYHIEGNTICKISWREEKDAAKDSVSIVIQDDFNDWLDRKNLRDEVNDERGWPVLDKYSNT